MRSPRRNGASADSPPFKRLYRPLSPNALYEFQINDETVSAAKGQSSTTDWKPEKDIPGWRRFVPIGANNASDVRGNNIAYISCDDSAYPGNLKADDTIRTVVLTDSRPKAIVLYSTKFEHCNYSSTGLTWPPYRNVFTVTDVQVSRDILAGLFSESQSNEEMSDIVPDLEEDLPRPGNDHGRRNNAAPAAMIILYSITGIITALFLSVIVTGAIRAHLNPERYGPRNIVGRPRQSRAKGIARAMLETIPIIKFDDSSDGTKQTVKSDIEMVSNDGGGEHDLSRNGTGQGVDGVKIPGSQTEPQEEQQQQQQQQQQAQQQQKQQESLQEQEDKPTASPRAKATDRESHCDGSIGPASPEPQVINPDVPPETGTLGCPICTDDFIKGQDVRLLPCQHKFHPECVDPWLINVSGTCPLCRVNLNPPDSDNADGSDHDHNSEDPTRSPSPPQNSHTNRFLPPLRNPRGFSRRYHGLSTLFSPSSTSGMGTHANVEDHIYTLRGLRRSRHERDANMTARGAIEGQDEEGEASLSSPGAGAAEDRSRRSRLWRLRGRFLSRSRSRTSVSSYAEADADAEADVMRQATTATVLNSPGIDTGAGAANPSGDAQVADPTPQVTTATTTTATTTTTNTAPT
ncbi:hypothetical protein PAAG_06507 [Paracoccidioides lutzii Pb01]|uniref:RING-type E3 ubiquitin transferase n=1 Tax=Paracoccidioides lutzii (strain ATCC MYA-826 / Pb01) TaxID=502779 RepID=C1H6W6_PARBA|nr:hypothetical protein PAAG_06507 [Paracoccidioides lutzii Pb01]EEH35460.2 hypothetical protein PAAG_06507 [Paracoccidioides lutzii Pb01]